MDLEYVWVSWDPLHERVICVHSEDNMVCDECNKVRNSPNRGHYHIFSNKFKIKFNTQIERDIKINKIINE